MFWPGPKYQITSIAAKTRATRRPKKSQAGSSCSWTSPKLRLCESVPCQLDLQPSRCPGKVVEPHVRDRLFEASLKARSSPCGWRNKILRLLLPHRLGRLCCGRRRRPGRKTRASAGVYQHVVAPRNCWRWPPLLCASWRCWPLLARS